MLKYLFSLNGEELQDVSIGVSVIEKFEEPLDEGHLNLPISILNYEYDMRGLLRIVISDEDLVQEEFYFLVLEDDVKEGSKYGEWIHELRVLEYTHKLDNYMIYSLAKTKTLKNTNPAPFEILDNDFLFFDYTGSEEEQVITARAYLEPIEILTTYYTNELLELPIVEEAYVATTTSPTYWDEYVRKPVFVRTDAPDLDEVELSDVATHWRFPKGRWYIEYGFDSNLDIRTWVYKFYINVVDRDELSVYDLIMLVRDSISKFGSIESKRYYDDTRLFDIDPEIVDKLKSVEAPQTFIQKATARQVLNSIFLYMNSISRLKYVDGDMDLLTMDEFNKINGTFRFEDISNYATSQDASQLSNVGVSWVENALPNDLEEATLKSPASDMYRTVRSQDVQIRQDNFTIPLERKLYLPKKLENIFDSVRIVSTNTYADTGLYAERFISNFVLDLTSRLINREEWLLKITTNDFPDMVLHNMFDNEIGLRENKVENLYWQRGDMQLHLSEAFGLLFQDNLIYNVIRSAFNEYFTRNLPAPFVGANGTIATRIGIKIEDWEDFYDNFRNLKFNFEYISNEDMTIQSEREDLSYSPYYAESRLNQSDKIVNIGTISRKNYGDLQRSGVPSITFSKHHDKVSTLFKTGMQDDENNVIIKRKLILYNQHILALYATTKDHNRLSEFIGLDQLYRWSEIPTSNQVFTKNERYRDYVVIYAPHKTLYGNITKIETLAKQLIFRTLYNDLSLEKTKVTLAYIRTDGFLENFPDDETYKYAVSTPVSSFGVKGGFVFTFGFENNQVAGDSIKTSVNGGSTLYWNEAVRYTNNQGTFNELWFQLSTNYVEDTDGWTEAERLSKYPLVRCPVSQAQFGGNVTARCGSTNSEISTHDPLIVYKDSSQNIKISYQINIISETYLEYVFGQMFFSENFIVKNPLSNYNGVIGKKMYLYRYNDGTRFGKFDDLIVQPNYYSKIELDDTNASFYLDKFTLLGIDLSTTTSWAIGDDLGNLYVACNDNHDGFKVATVHHRPNQLEIGNK